MNTTQPNCRAAALAGIALIVLAHGLFAATGKPPSEYFTIQVVDRQTGRGVPLVELRTTNSIRLFTDSNGIVAFREPGLMDREVFFLVESHGYEVPKDGFGYRGFRLQTTPGQEAVVKINRLNIAERLYRITGQGIYRDSILTGRPVPLKNPLLNGQVMGQDSVFTCLYHGRLFWMWGDTGKASYPLGNFAMSGALSDLPEHGGLDPAVGVDLEYYVDERGFSRKMAPLKEPGLVWLDGLMTVPDQQGQERMVARFARLKGLGEVLERGLMVFNDATNTFEPLVRPGLEFLPYRNTGHAFPVQVAGRSYHYFTTPSPLSVRMRVPVQWDDVGDANRYEVLTALGEQGPRGKSGPGGCGSREDPSLASRPSGPAPQIRWVRFGDVLASMGAGKAALIAALEAEAKGVNVCNVESGRAILPHNGTVYFNAYRQRWIGIFGQLFGGPSALGEIWYAEADTPVGPWAYARKIMTHHKYSFYNPKHHPLFDRDGGRTIYFEGTYSWTFSGSEETATPRYDYNQIMYRLNLDDPRLTLPAPVYQVRDGQGGRDYLMRDAVTQADRWDAIESVAFYAVEPDRAGKEFIPVYVDTVSTANGPARRLTTEPQSSSKPLFYAWPLSETKDANPCITPLYEYRHTRSGQFLYSTEPQSRDKDWERVEKPLCRVAKAPLGPLLLDSNTRPAPIN